MISTAYGALRRKIYETREEAEMKAISRFRAAMLVSLFWIARSEAGIVSTEELCAQGDARACRIEELAKKIDLQKLLADGQYRFMLGPTALFSAAPRDAKAKQAMLRQAACTFYAEVWINELVEEYGRLTDLRIVDVENFNICLSAEQ